MQITLPAHLEQFLADQVSRGVFTSTDEAVCKAVENMQTLEQRRAALLTDLNAAAAQAACGEVVEVKPEDLRHYLETKLQNAIQRTTQNV